jgi:serine/alanine adding enzyme
MNIIANKEINHSKLFDIYRNSSNWSPFQTMDFFNFLNTLNDLSAEAICIEESHEYQAFCVIALYKYMGKLSHLSRRAIIYGGIALKDDPDSNPALEKLLSTLTKALKGKAIYCEIRNSFDYSVYRDVFDKYGWKYEPHLNVQLNLKNKTAEEILAEMQYNRRREIKMSLKEGALVKEAISTSEVENLYSIVRVLYKQKVHLPVPALEFFINLFKSPIGKIFIVHHAEKVIGGAFCIYMPGNSIYTLYYAGLRDYHQRIFPTHLAIWGAINFGLKNHLNMVDFMGAGKPDVPYGVRDYKLKFGGELVEHGRFVYAFNPFLYKIGKFGIRLLSKMSL